MMRIAALWIGYPASRGFVKIHQKDLRFNWVKSPQ